MAGHSKWANIKHRKAAQDKKRGKLYTKLIREITVAARLGGGMVDDNPRLRAAVDKALAPNCPMNQPHSWAPFLQIKAFDSSPCNGFARS